MYFNSPDITSELNNGNESYRGDRFTENVATNTAHSQYDLYRATAGSVVLSLPQVVQSEADGKQKWGTRNGDIRGIQRQFTFPSILVTSS